jgi:hypothetical protein
MYNGGGGGNSYIPSIGGDFGGGMGGAMNGAGIGGGIGSYLGGIFGGMNAKNPFDASGKIYGQIPGMIQGDLGPWSQMGMHAANFLQPQLEGMVSNPGGYINGVGQNFHQSPGFAFALNQALQSGNNASAALGQAGSLANQQQQMSTATQLGNQDYYNWLNQALGMANSGIQGLGQQSMLGENAASTMAQAMAQAMGNQANNAANQAGWQNQQQQNMWGGIGGLLGSGIGAAAGM